MNTPVYLFKQYSGLQKHLQSLTEKCTRSSKSSSTNEEHHEGKFSKNELFKIIIFLSE